MAAKDNIVGEVGLRVTPIDPGFNAGVKKIIDNLEREAQFKVGADTTQANQAVDQLIQKNSQLADSWVQAGVQVAAFTAAVYGVRAAVDSVINKFSGLFDQLEQAKAGFRSILNSDQAGASLLADIQEFARVSPFVTQELVNYSQQLLGVGLAAEKIVPLLEDTGNIISSVGGDTQNIGRVLFTLTQIQSIGRLTGQDAIQLQSALIPITKYLADYLGKTTAQVKKMQEAGSISAETVFAAIEAQGEKVVGAMDLATRTIGGAKSVLSDTITIFLQGQPVLNRINQDIIAGIKAIAAALGEEEIQASFAKFFEGVERVYDGLLPLVEVLVSFGSGTGLSSLSLFTTLLETLGVVLETIPEPVLKAIALSLSALAAVKAPVALALYIANLQRFATGLFGVGTSAVNASKGVDTMTASLARQQATMTTALVTSKVYAGTLDQINANLAKQTAASQFAEKSFAGRAAERARAAATNSAALGTVAATGAIVAGSLVSDGQGGERDALGTFLTSAGTGAAIGSLAGPVGTAVGAIGGAAFGSITAINNAKDKVKEDAKKFADEIATTYATEFTEELLAVSGGTITPKGLESYFEEVNSYNELIATYRSSIASVEEDLKAAIDNDAGLGEIKDITEQIGRFETAIADFENTRDKLIADNQFAEYFGTISSKLALLEGSAEGTATQFVENLGPAIGGATGAFVDADAQRQIEILTGQADLASITNEEIAALDAQFRQLGVTWEDVYSKGATDLQNQIDRFTGLPDAWKDGIRAASDYALELEKVKKASAEIFGPFNKEISESSAELRTLEETNKSLVSLFQKTTDLAGNAVPRTNISDVEANAVGAQILADSTRVYEQSLAELTPTLGKADAEIAAQNRSMVEANGQFQILQEALGKTDAEFKRYLDSVGLLTFYNTTLDAGLKTNVDSLGELAERLGITEAQVREFYSLSDDANGATQIISTEDTDEIAIKLKEITDQLNESGNSQSEIVYLTEQQTLLTRELDGAVREVNLALEEQKNVQREILASYVGQAEQYLLLTGNAKAFSDTLGKLYEVNDDGVIAVTTDLTVLKGVADSVVSASLAAGDQAIKNGSSEIEAVAVSATKAVTGFEAMQTALGQTDEQFQATLTSLGLYDEYLLALERSGGFIQGTLGDVATQVGLTNEELFELAGLTGALDTNVQIIITADTTQAIERIREIDEELENARGAERTALQGERATLAANVASSITSADPNLTAQQRESDAIAKRAAEKAAADAEKAQEEARRALEQWQQTVISTTQSLTDTLQSAADSIAEAADRWVGSIKERTQYEQAVSASRLANNADRQSADLIESQAGLENLRARGVTDEVLQALGIDNIGDTRQIRKLVRSSDADLQRLTSSVGRRDELATKLAISEEDKRTRDNITAGIVAAAKELEIDLTGEQAAAISNQFNITPNLNAEELAFQILGILSGGRITR
jgi:tape measure domain-containing protein